MNNRFEHGGNIYKVHRENGISENEIIDFSANINPIGLSEYGKKAYIEALDMINNYPDPDYVKLREVISEYHNISIDNLFIGNGAIEMIYKTFQFINPKKALIISPTFVEYERALNKIGVLPNFYILNEEENFEIDIKKLKMYAHDYELIVLCSPNNPTGKLTCKNEIIEIMTYIVENNLECKFFLDEAFIDFVSEEESMIDIIERFKNLFILRSATKFFAIPGLRIGYVISSNEKLRNFYKSYHIPWSINTVAQEVLIASLGDKEYIKETIKLNKLSRDYLFKSLIAINDIKVFESKGNYIFFKLLKSIDLRDELLKRGILIRSCANYIGLDETYYRVAVKGHDQNMKLIEVLFEVFNND